MPALDGFTIGSNNTPAQATPATAPKTSGALAGFTIGAPKATATPKTVVATTPKVTPPNTDNLFTESVKLFGNIGSGIGNVAKAVGSGVDNFVKGIASGLGSQQPTTPVQMAPDYIPAQNQFVNSKTGEPITESERALLNQDSMAPTQSQALQDRLNNPIPKPVIDPNLKISQGKALNPKKRGKNEKKWRAYV